MPSRNCLRYELRLMLSQMQNRSPARATSVPLYALGAIFLVPLGIGVLLVNSNASRNDHANQVSRDVASMYSQGVDFSNTANQNIALNVADGLGMNLRDGKGLLILSKIRVVHESDCSAMAAPACANKGYAVVTQRFVIGNKTLRPSSFGTPTVIDSTGNVHNWASDISARAEEFPANLKSGEFTFAAECYLTTQESRNGVYSRAMF
jgi:hypothetical protein